VTLRILALMSRDVYESFTEACAPYDCTVSWWNPDHESPSQLRDSEVFDGIVVEDPGALSEDVASKYSDFSYLPQATLSLESGASSRNQGQSASVILGSPEDLESWLARVAAGEATGVGKKAPGGTPGMVITVVGSGGSPGRSMVAEGLARESGKAGRKTLLIDADTSEPGLTFHLGLSGSRSGWEAALRSARVSEIDLEVFLSHTVNCTLGGSAISVLTGFVPSSDSELPDADGYQRLLETFRQAGYTVIIDTAGIARTPEAVTEDSPWREKLPVEHLSGLSDHVVVVMQVSERGVSRMIRAWHQSLSLIPPSTLIVLAREFEPLSQAAKDGLRHTVWEYTALERVYFVGSSPAQKKTGPLDQTSTKGWIPRSLAEELFGVAGNDAHLAPRKRVNSPRVRHGGRWRKVLKRLP